MRRRTGMGERLRGDPGPALDAGSASPSALVVDGAAILHLALLLVGLAVDPLVNLRLQFLKDLPGERPRNLVDRRVDALRRQVPDRSDQRLDSTPDLRSDAPAFPGLEMPRLAGDRVDETLAVDDADVPSVVTAEVNGQALLVHGRAGASRLVAAACLVPGVQALLLGAGTEAGDDVDTAAGHVHDVLDPAPEAGIKTQVAPLVHQGVAELLEQGQCSASVLRVRGDHELGVNPRPLTHDGAGPVRDEPATDLLVRDDATLRHQRHRAAAASGAPGLSGIAHDIDVPDLADLEVDPDRVGDRVD